MWDFVYQLYQSDNLKSNLIFELWITCLDPGGDPVQLAPSAIRSLEIFRYHVKVRFIGVSSMPLASLLEKFTEKLAEEIEKLKLCLPPPLDNSL